MNHNRKIYDIFEMVQNTDTEELVTKLLKYLIDTYNNADDNELRDDLARIIGCKYYNAISDYDENDNIITYFKELILDKKNLPYKINMEVLNSNNLFFSKVNPFLKMTDINCLTKKEEQTYIYKIYVMLYAYHLYKDNYDCFKRIVDTIFKPSKYLNGFKDVSVVMNKDIIKNILDIKNKSKDNNTYELSDYNDLYELLYKFSNMVKTYDIKDKTINKQLTLMREINDYMCKLEKKEIPLLLNKNYIFDIMKENNFMILSEVLLIESTTDRFTYVKDKVNKIEDEEVLKKDLVKRIGNLSCLLFDYLDCLGDNIEDSFKKYIGSVFESDSYYELDKKMDILEEINKYITDNYKVDYKQFRNLAPNERKKIFDLDNEHIKDLLDKFNSQELKEIRNGYIISYDNSKLPNHYKPEHIRGRMYELYKEAFSGTEGFPKEYYGSKVTASYPTYFHSNNVTRNDEATIKDFIQYLDKNIEEISVMQKVKEKENKNYKVIKELEHNYEFMHENKDVYVSVEDGFSYVADKIKRFESCPGLRKDLAYNIEKIGSDLFFYLDSIGIKDSFKKCINSIFDSDTYYEVYNKLEVLQTMASHIDKINKTKYHYRYLTEEVKKQLCPLDKDYMLMYLTKLNIDGLHSNDVLEKRNGQVMSYNGLDVQKPAEVRERMANLYSKAYDGNKYFVTEEGTNKIDAYYSSYWISAPIICSQEDDLTIEEFLRYLERNIEDIKKEKENQKNIVKIVEPSNLKLSESDFDDYTSVTKNSDTQEDNKSVPFTKRLFKKPK